MTQHVTIAQDREFRTSKRFLLAPVPKIFEQCVIMSGPNSEWICLFCDTNQLDPIKAQTVSGLLVRF